MKIFDAIFRKQTVIYDDKFTVSQHSFTEPSDDMKAELSSAFSTAPIASKADVKSLLSHVPSSAISKGGSAHVVLNHIMSCLKQDFADLRANHRVKSITKMQILPMKKGLQINLVFDLMDGGRMFWPHIVYRKSPRQYQCVLHTRET